jgi:hypothetical protein
MRILSRLLLAVCSVVLVAGSAAAVPMGNFYCSSGDRSALCGWGEQNLAADLREYRSGSAILTITMGSSPYSLDLEDVLLECSGGDLPQVRRLFSFGSAHSYHVSYRGSFDNLLDHLYVGVELGYRYHRQTFWGHHGDHDHHDGCRHGSPVPEPSAALLFAIGTATVGLAVRRR